MSDPVIVGIISAVIAGIAGIIGRIIVAIITRNSTVYHVQVKGQEMPSERVESSFEKRLFAQIADIFVVCVFMFVLVAIFQPPITGDVFILLNAPVYIAYQTFLLGLFGQTLGKSMFGMKVTTSNSVKPGLIRAFLRATISLTMSFINLWLLVFGVGRLFHDLICDTYVIKR